MDLDKKFRLQSQEYNLETLKFKSLFDFCVNKHDRNFVTNHIDSIADVGPLVIERWIDNSHIPSLSIQNNIMLALEDISLMPSAKKLVPLNVQEIETEKDDKPLRKKRRPNKNKYEIEEENRLKVEAIREKLKREGKITE